MNRNVADALFYVLLLITQIIAAIFYGIYHDHIFDAVNDPRSLLVTGSASRYPVFQDIHIMVYVGIGFLFAFLKRYRLSAITEVFWLAAITVQYYFLWNALFFGAWKTYGPHFITTTADLIKGEFCAISMVVAFGALVGKANNIQLLISVLIGILLFCVNEQILFNSLDVRDIGGSMYIFVFGAFYGLGISWMLNYKEAKNNRNYVTSVNSNNFGLIGTLFLWCFFPSFNSALAATPLDANIAVVNTYFCLIGSVLGAIFMSKILWNGKYHIEIVLNATLVGGILMGSGADILRESFVAYIVGGVGGIMAAFMFTYISKIWQKLGLTDVAGVYHTFAIPGICGGLLSAIYRARYFDRGGIQVAGTFISMAISLAGGLVVGILVRWLGSYNIDDEYYNDQMTVHFDNEADYHANPAPFFDSRNRLLFGSHVHHKIHQVDHQERRHQPNETEQNYLNDREVAPDL